MKEMLEKLKAYRFPLLILLLGAALMLLPSGSARAPEKEASLGEALSLTQGVGEAYVLISDSGVIVVCEGAGAGLLAHELGHSMQNCRFGPFMPFLVGIPSSFRYHARRIFTRITGKEPRSPYDAAWFEGQATAVGREYVKKTAV